MNWTNEMNYDLRLSYYQSILSRPRQWKSDRITHGWLLWIVKTTRKSWNLICVEAGEKEACNQACTELNNK